MFSFTKLLLKVIFSDHNLSMLLSLGWKIWLQTMLLSQSRVGFLIGRIMLLFMVSNDEKGIFLTCLHSYKKQIIA